MRISRWTKRQGGARIHTQSPALDRTRRREQHALIAWVPCALDRRDTAGRLVLLMESGLRSSPSHPRLEMALPVATFVVAWPQGLSVPTLVNIGEPAHGQMNTQEMHHFDWQAAEPLVSKCVSSYSAPLSATALCPYCLSARRVNQCSAHLSPRFLFYLWNEPWPSTPSEASASCGPSWCVGA